MAYDFNKEAYYGNATPQYVPNPKPGASEPCPCPCPPEPSPSPSPSPEPWGPLPDVEEQSARIKNGAAKLGDVEDVLAAILVKEEA